MDEMNTHIIAGIITLMGQQNLTIEGLSKLSTLSQRTISKVLSGKATPSISVLKKICNVFGLNTCEFFDDIIINHYIKKCV